MKKAREYFPDPKKLLIAGDSAGAFAVPALAAEVIDANGNPFPGFSVEDCTGLVRVDSTKRALSWKGGDLSRFAGKPVRFRFKMKVATLYAFWVSKDASGKSGGYLAAGGPDYAGPKDE